MQNIIKETIKAGKSIRTGGARYLLIRNASNSITLQLDTFEPVEIKKNDVVLTEGCTTVILSNHHSSEVELEYQITDISINTQSDSIAINGAINVNEIIEPVVISHVQSAVPVVLDDKTVTVDNWPKGFEVDNPVEIANFPKVQKVEITNSQTGSGGAAASPPILNPLTQIVLHGEKTIPANPKRKGLIVIAPETNSSQIIIAGFIPMKPGATSTIPASNALLVTGTSGDVLNLAEVL